MRWFQKTDTCRINKSQGVTVEGQIQLVLRVLEDFGRSKVLSATLHQRAQTRVVLMFGPARLTLNEVTPNFHIYQKAELTIDVSMN